MAEDQYAQRDPRDQYPRPEEQRGQVQRHPGSGAAMAPEPDHGENSYRGSDRLMDRKAVITGGDSGIGRAVAVAFARESADVLLSYLPEEQDDAEKTAELVREAGREAVLVPGDIRDEQLCGQIVDRAVEVFGRIDVLVNNERFSSWSGCVGG